MTITLRRVYATILLGAFLSWSVMAEAEMVDVTITATVIPNYTPLFGQTEPSPATVSFRLDTSAPVFIPAGTQIGPFEADLIATDLYGYQSSALSVISSNYGTKTWDTDDVVTGPLGGYSPNPSAAIWFNGPVEVGGNAIPTIVFDDSDGRMVTAGLACGLALVDYGCMLLDRVDIVEYSNLARGNGGTLTISIVSAAGDPCAALGGDSDGDGVCENNDNCPNVPNVEQSDLNGDGVGDVCGDMDGDTVKDDADTWPFDPDDDLDNDGYPSDPFGICKNVCLTCLELQTLCLQVDNCPGNPNSDQIDTDGDGVGDVCDPDASPPEPDCGEPPLLPCDAPPPPADSDGDGVPDSEDNCPDDVNPYNLDTNGDLVNDAQTDLDGDGLGEECDPDDDGDGVADEAPDNCPRIANPAQQDLDCDNIGDACDDDIDGDGWTNEYEIGTTGTSPTDADTDGDSIIDGPSSVLTACPAGLTLGPDTEPLGPPPEYEIIITPNVDRDTWLPTPWDEATGQWKPEEVLLSVALFENATAYSGVVTYYFEIVSTSSYEGNATNQSEEFINSPSNDFSFSGTDPEVLAREVTVAGHPARVSLYARDFGGRVTIRVSTEINGITVASLLMLPLDSDNDNLPDIWEVEHGLNPSNAHTISADKLDGAADIDTSRNNSYTGDGLTNFREYRGVVFDDPAGNYHKRLDPRRKDLFVRGDNFANSVIKNDTAAGVLPFSVNYAQVYNVYDGKSAFEAAGIQVYDVTGMPAFVDFDNPSWEPPNIDILVVTNRTETRPDGLIQTLPTESSLGIEDGYINHPSVLLPRYWTWDLKGASYVGNAQLYAASEGGTTATHTYHLCLMNYVYNRPYMNDAWEAEGNNCYSADYLEKLDPLSLVEDYYQENGGGPDAKGNIDEDRCIVNGQLDGDRMDPYWKSAPYNTKVYEKGHQYSVFDADGDALVEHPPLTDPFGLSSSTLDAGEYTIEQIQLHTVLHEMGHAVGVGVNHTDDEDCLMYEESTNWSRAGYFSPYAEEQILIHNKTEQF